MTAQLLKLPWQNIRNIVLAPMSRKLGDHFPTSEGQAA
jgi:hypothetical protein